MAQWVKDPGLSLQQLRLLLWRSFDPWPRDFHMPQHGQKNKHANMKKEGGGGEGELGVLM